jgi:hypothetical protein
MLSFAPYVNQYGWLRLGIPLEIFWPFFCEFMHFSIIILINNIYVIDASFGVKFYAQSNF